MKQNTFYADLEELLGYVKGCRFLVTPALPVLARKQANLHSNLLNN